MSRATPRTALSRKANAVAHRRANTTPSLRKPVGPPRVEGQNDPTEHDERSPDEQHGLERLPEEGDREEHGKERRRADEDGRPRRACPAHGLDEAELREPGDGEPDQQERPELRERVRHPRHEKRDECSDEEGGRRHHDASEDRIAATEEAGAHGHGHRAEERAREEPEEDGIHLILYAPTRVGDHDAHHRRHGSRVIARAVAGASAVGFAAGWNIADTGAVADELAGSYGVGLATVGLFTTVLFVAHLLMQLPSGRLSDRFGPLRVCIAGLVVMAVCNAIALAAPEPWLLFLARTLIGVGTALGFIGGSDFVRASGGTPFAQGLYGGLATAGGGVALAVVPALEGGIGWRAPFVSAIAVAGVAGSAPRARTAPDASRRSCRERSPADGARP